MAVAILEVGCCLRRNHPVGTELTAAPLEGKSFLGQCAALGVQTPSAKEKNRFIHLCIWLVFYAVYFAYTTAASIMVGENWDVPMGKPQTIQKVAARPFYVLLERKNKPKLSTCRMQGQYIVLIGLTYCKPTMVQNFMSCQAMSRIYIQHSLNNVLCCKKMYWIITTVTPWANCNLMMAQANHTHSLLKWPTISPMTAYKFCSFPDS